MIHVCVSVCVSACVLGVLSSDSEEAEGREVRGGRGGAIGCHRDLPAAARGVRGAADARRVEVAARSFLLFLEQRCRAAIPSEAAGV